MNLLQNFADKFQKYSLPNNPPHDISYSRKCDTFYLQSNIYHLDPVEKLRIDGVVA